MSLDPRAEGAHARLADVKRILAVTGGKGGIGKSSVASVLALASARSGRPTGLLDLDLTSPSTHVLLGYPTAFPEEPFGIDPCDHHGVRCMSIAHFARDHAAPMRGDDTTNALLELLAITNWRELDLLVVDMPPGLGDAVLDLARIVPRAEHLVVTTSSRVVLHSVDRMLQLLGKIGAPVAGVIENMTRASSAASAELAARHDVAYLGALPFDVALEDAAGDPDALCATDFAGELQRCLPALGL